MSPMRFEPVRLGVVGMGSFGRLHALTAAGLAEAELVALVARRQASLDACADELPGVRGWLNLREAVADSDAEAWIVASSTTSHVPLTKTLLAAGKQVLLEKPMAENLLDAQSLAPLIKPDSSNLMLGHILLFNSEFRKLMAEAAQRGPLNYLSCVRHRCSRHIELYPGESPFHLTMVHDLYTVQALMNRAEPVRFSAQTHCTREGACDLALAQLKWESGTVASFASSFLTPEGMGMEAFDRMEVFGEGWTARLRPNPRPIELWDDRARQPMALEILADPAGSSGMLAEELRCFCRVVRGEQAVPIGATYADALQLEGWLERLQSAAEA